MQSIQRTLPVAALVATLALAACGGGTPTAAPGTAAPGGSLPSGTGAPASTTGVGGDLQNLDSMLLAPVFGTNVPAPTCDTMGEDGFSCRWIANEGELLVDADADPTFESEEAWRAAFGTAGFDEEVPGIGVAALGGDNPLADGWRASAYASDGVAYTVTVNKPGDTAAVKAIVLAILTSLAN